MFPRHLICGSSPIYIRIRHLIGWPADHFTYIPSVFDIGMNWSVIPDFPYIVTRCLICGSATIHILAHFTNIHFTRLDVCRRTSWSMPRSDVICTVELNMLPAEHLIVAYVGRPTSFPRRFTGTEYLCIYPRPSHLIPHPQHVMQWADPSLLTTGIHKCTHIPINIRYKDQWAAPSHSRTGTHGPCHHHRCQYTLGPPVTIGYFNVYH